MASTKELSLICFLFLFGVFSSNAVTIYPKQLAGPPSEFSSHQLPSPQAAAQVQQSALIPFWVTSDDQSMTEVSQDILWTGAIYVDSDTEFQLAFASPFASSTKLVFTDPNGNNVPLGEGFPGGFPIGATEVPETTWIFKNPVVGKYTLTLQSTDTAVTRRSVTDDDVPIGFAFTLNISPISMVGHLNTYNLQQGQEIGLVAMIIDNPQMKNRSEFDISNVRILQDVIFEALMEVTLPDGTEEDVQMQDDGLHNDGAANDGVYGGSIKAASVGTYKAQAFLQGQTSNGVQFLRTTQHLIASVTDQLTLSGTATGSMIDSDHLAISLDVDADTEVHDADQTFNVYAEVYGVDLNGNQQPACWVGGISSIQSINGENIINVVLDTKWLSYSNVKAPLTLKNILIQETSAFIPIASSDNIPVTIESSVLSKLTLSLSSYEQPIITITKEMRQGVFPKALLENPNSKSNKTGVILVHGYCSGTNPWSPYPTDWSDDVYYFLQPSASMTNDNFAKAVLAYAESEQLSAYSIVGHSQGGIVGTHILNFYFSGLDKITGNLDKTSTGRKVQSLGTPFKGCSAAGSAASLGEAFGIGCGTNFDLSLDGSLIWEPSVTSVTRSEVYYYTTTYNQGNFFGDYCNMAINMILEWPNDGTTEFVYANLKSANFMGNTQAQCHITDMAYPAQYYDHSRNQQMNGAAGR